MLKIIFFESSAQENTVDHISIPVFSFSSQELEMKIDSFISSESECYKHDSTLIFYLTIFKGFFDDSVLVLSMESQRNIQSIFRLRPDGVREILGHMVFLYNNDPNDLFSFSNSNLEITLKKSSIKNSKQSIPIITPEDDRYSMITYFFKDNELRLYEKSIKCP